LTEAIPRTEVVFQALTVDACGRLFRWRDRVFRAIHPAAVQSVRNMFASGLIDELVKKRLFVRSSITGHTLEGYGLVVEHDEVAPLVYPYEWSFSMLKDAALAVLELNRVAGQHGYELADCHGYNVCFDGTQPLFVDLGSLVPADETRRGWRAYEEFLTFYEFPLRIWSHGNHYFARRALLGCSLNDALTPANYLLYQHPLARLLPRRQLARLAAAWMLGRRLAHSMDSLARKIRALSVKPRPSDWGDYQASYYDRAGDPKPSPRFDRIAAVLHSLGVRSVLELGGNQGAFALQLHGLHRVTCTDRDEGAVDALYLRAKARGASVVPAVLDFMFPLTNYAGNRPPFDRYAADAVVVLAVTHHLLLAQGLSIEHVVRTIAAYARRFALVEFMPLGLSSPGKPVAPPAWYTEAWFREAFESNFRVISVERLEENRVLFVGERH
jgi:hypothetical protein